MNALAALPYVWSTTLALYGVCEHQQLQQTVDRSWKIEIGMGERDVLALLGEPDLRWRPGPSFPLGWPLAPRRWVYGTTLDWRNFLSDYLPFPNPVPLKWRFFAPDEEDLVIDWSDRDTVVRVRRPQFRH